MYLFIGVDMYTERGRQKSVHNNSALVYLTVFIYSLVCMIVNMR